MKLFSKSAITGIEYCPEDSIRIMNLRQVLFYMEHDVEIQDVFVSTDYRTGKDILIFMVDRLGSQSIYEEWKQNYGAPREIDEPIPASELDKNEVRVLNIFQVIYYMNRDVLPKSFYPSIDYKTGEHVLVFIFDKNESAEAYASWQNNKANSRSIGA